MSGSPYGTASSTTPKAPGLAAAAWCDDEQVCVRLTDGRVECAPLPDFLRVATPEQRRRCEVEDLGTAIHWPELDEDLGVDWILGVDEDVLLTLAGYVDLTPEGEDTPTRE